LRGIRNKKLEFLRLADFWEITFVSELYLSVVCVILYLVEIPQTSKGVTMTVALATENQISFLESLATTRVISTELPVFATLTKSEASELIGKLKNLPYLPRPAKVAPANDLVEGIYFRDGEVYKAKKSSAGRIYALKLVGSSWSYDTAHVRVLTPSHLITLEQASEFGIRTGVCAICGIPLTNLDSLERGIGPVCAKRFG
jgi:hypothetical protein